MGIWRPVGSISIISSFPLRTIVLISAFLVHLLDPYELLGETHHTDRFICSDRECPVAFVDQGVLVNLIRIGSFVSQYTKFSPTQRV